MNQRELELYIHIPFCVKKCAYCDFLSGPADQKTRADYVEALCREIVLAGESETLRKTDRPYIVPTIFIGGGTPSVLTAEETARIMRTAAESFAIAEDAEITMEVNPGTADRDRLISYKKCGINRLSIGLQSANDEELRILGRIHNYNTFLETYQAAREAGFDSLNVDLISAVPGQTLPGYEESLKKIIALEPEHISAYSLMIEEGTPFFERYQEDKTTAGYPPLPDEETERRMYMRTKELLERAGYRRYEISNYAKPGKECRHNIGYWQRKEYLGLGIGAASLLHETRFTNKRDLKEYIALMQDGAPLEQLRENYETLSEMERMKETMMLGLRMDQGVSCQGFRKMYGKDLEEVYPDVISKYIGYGLLRYGDGCLKLTEQGISVSNLILADFM